MPRIQIELPERFTFATEIPIQLRDVNIAGHLDQAVVLSLATEARVRYFIALGYQVGNVEGCAAITADSVAQYVSESFYGEVIVAEMAMRDFNKYGCDCVFRFSDKAGGREIARGKLGIVFTDKETRKIAPIPPQFRAKAELSIGG